MNHGYHARNQRVIRRMRAKPAPGHTIFPYLLRKLPAQSGLGYGYHVYPMAQGFVYLAAVVDQFSRKVLAWKLSITLETEFCLEAVEEALARASPRSSTPIRAPNSPASPSPACCSRTRSRSAWMGKAPGETTSSSSACGG